MPSLMALERIRAYSFAFSGTSDDIFNSISFDNNFKLIKRKGTIVSFGNTSGAVEPFLLTKLVEKNVKLLRPT